MMDAMNQVSKAMKEIKKAHKLLEGWKKALDAGTKTQFEYDATLRVAKRVIARNFLTASAAGLALGQSDEMGYDARSLLHADDVIQDATK